MKKLELNQMENLEGGRKFWGSEPSWGACGPNTNGTAGCFEGQYTTYYVFWFATGAPRPTGVTRPCAC